MKKLATETTSKAQPAVVWPFVVVILTQMLFAGFSVYTLSAIRAYVTGESLWSKGQHEAIYFLSLYINSGDEAFLKRYESAIITPLADRKGRLALEAPEPDKAAARAAFRDARNAPEDITGLIWLFNNFRSFSYLQHAVEQWKKAEVLILKMDRLAAAIQTEKPWAAKDPKATAPWLQQLEDIDADITPRTVAFSRFLGEGARFVESALTIVNLALAALLAGLTIWRVRRFLSQRQAIERKLAWQASHDSLTGIANRRAFELRLAAAMTTVTTCRVPHALMFVDLDQFKIVNDTCGHAAGDELLRRVCGPLQARLQEGDLLARLGGDEFGILLTNATIAHAADLAELMRAAVQDLDFVWTQRSFGVTASIGLVHTDQGFVTLEEMMRAADMACFMAKEKGRNRVHVHRHEDRDLLRHAGEMNWVQRIHQALNENRFCLYAQEIAPLAAADDEGLHLELLIRLRDETGTVVPPASFLPAAERFGLMKLIDRWVVRSAFQLIATRLNDRHAQPIACCAINLSGTTIGDEAFLGFLKDTFVTFAIPAHLICFEITETSAITNLEAAAAFVRDLSALGCRFSLDDFGSGMSSFGYLKSLPVDFLKIDGGFVRNMTGNKVDRAMVEMINHIGHIMGKRIIAECVEDHQTADLLRHIGVDYAQGYGIARPQPFDEAFGSTRARLKSLPVRMIA